MQHPILIWRESCTCRNRILIGSYEAQNFPFPSQTPQFYFFLFTLLIILLSILSKPKKRFFCSLPQTPIPKSQEITDFSILNPNKREKKNFFLERESKHSPRNLCNQIRTCVCNPYTTLIVSERKKKTFFFPI